MLGGQHVRDVTLFVTLYLVLSLLPFVALNREVLADISDSVLANPVTIAVGGTLLFIIISGLFLASEGVDRYNQFLFAPTDALSVLVELSFVLAAISWWLIPELSFRLEWGLEFDMLLVAIIAFQLPMVLFLSLMTAVGKA